MRPQRVPTCFSLETSEVLTSWNIMVSRIIVFDGMNIVQFCTLLCSSCKIVPSSLSLATETATDVSRRLMLSEVHTEIDSLGMGRVIVSMVVNSWYEITAFSTSDDCRTDTELARQDAISSMREQVARLKYLIAVILDGLHKNLCHVVYVLLITK